MFAAQYMTQLQFLWTQIVWWPTTLRQRAIDIAPTNLSEIHSEQFRPMQGITWHTIPNWFWELFVCYVRISDSMVTPKRCTFSWRSLCPSAAIWYFIGRCETGRQSHTRGHGPHSGARSWSPCFGMQVLLYPENADATLSISTDQKSATGALTCEMAGCQ